MAVFNTINTLSTSTSTGVVKDTNAPYSFQDWKQRNTNIPPGELFKQYDAYLKAWYVKRDVTNVVSINYVKKYYKTFLQTIGVTARTAAEKELFDNVDINNDLSLQSVIVGYARRLKDVSVYLANKRNSVYYSKLKNNLTGTSTSLERLFYSYLLTSFTRKTTPDGQITTSFIVTDPSVLNALPYLSNVADSFNIQIEEIYDTANYFDRDPSVSISTYTTIASGVPEALYSAGSYSVEYGTPSELILANTVALIVQTATVTVINLSAAPAYFTFVGDGYTTAFVISNVSSNTASDYQVSIDGIVQTPNTSYSVSVMNQAITFNEAPPASTIIVVVVRY